MKNFKNKVVVVTGAGSGMGAAYADEFAKLGARLSLCDIDLAGLDETEARVKAIVGEENVYTQVVDVGEKNDVFAFADMTKAKFGNAHVIINNAGIQGSSEPIYVTDIEMFEKVNQVNFLGVVYGTKAFLPQLVENNEGAVVNVSSVFGLIAPPNCADYCAAKFAVRGFTESLSIEFSESPISIHCLHPGGIDTNIAREANSQEFAEKFLITPPHDIAKHVIKCIQTEKTKIVYGNQSKRAWFASNLLPQKWLNKILWNQTKDSMDLSSYKDFIK